MSFRESGYSFSSMERLKRTVRIGERKGVRSLMIVGLILKMSLALWRFILFIVVVTIRSVVCWREKLGVGGRSG